MLGVKTDCSKEHKDDSYMPYDDTACYDDEKGLYKSGTQCDENGQIDRASSTESPD